MPGETAKMEYFVQTNVSRWTYAELKSFCDILMEENSHVAKVLWPIVSTVDPSTYLLVATLKCFTLIKWFALRF